ncbi:MAG: 50S ribosomal protein L4 [Candidatus Cloacimonetes bacterium]|nr:50S ribosomal protein L4 [Candidatus Cloacimonadota bacterium]
MLKVKKYSAQGEEIGTVELPESLFNVESKGNRDALLYEVVNMYLANQRQGTASCKSRSEVKGSGRKLYRQKGTGSARPGNRRTPVRVGGGAAFGPKPQDWYRHIPKKKKRLALKLALTERAQKDQISVIEDLKLEKPDTKIARTLLEKISPERARTLVLIDGSDASIVRSFRNIPYVKSDRADGIYAYEVLRCNNLVITESALAKIVEVFNK